MTLIEYMKPFTDAAQNFAQGKNLELIDGAQLEYLIQQVD